MLYQLSYLPESATILGPDETISRRRFPALWRLDSYRLCAGLADHHQGVSEADAARVEAVEFGRTRHQPPHEIVEGQRRLLRFQMFPDDAPNTVKNFVDKANQGFYNGLTFHRVEDWVVQGGDPSGNGTGGGSMPSEISPHPVRL